MTRHEPVTTVERVVSDLEAAFSRSDVEGLLGLFAEDATLESYLVTRIFHREEGVARGRAELGQLLRALISGGVPWGAHRAPNIRGDTVVVEFMGPGPDAGTFSVDIIEVRDGKIQSLRAYAGWRALMAGATKPGTDR